MNSYIDIFHNQYDTVGKNGIARLMQQLGLKANLDMSYGEESHADEENTKRTLKNFEYSQWGTHKGYDLTAIANDIKLGYPVLLSGYSHKKTEYFGGIKVGVKYSHGHEWLVHGLLERTRITSYYNDLGVLASTKIECHTYLLCNWGWDGFKNGYYYSGAFNTNGGPSYPDSEPSTRSSDTLKYYQHKLTIFTGIRK